VTRGRTAESASLDGTALRQVFACFPSGVTAVCGLVNGEPVGFAASSFTSLSLDPPLALVCVGNSSSTWPKLQESPSIGVTVLGADQADICQQLSGRSEERFAGTEWRATDGGAVLIENASAWFECSIEDQVVAGDHLIVVLSILDVGAAPECEPLVFHGSRYRRVV
jgi:flavin reductase (DIM6/NTAB) family NADH-FMN oxidoreductase RutF